jgi:hypothetical protein
VEVEDKEDVGHVRMRIALHASDHVHVLAERGLGIVQ